MLREILKKEKNLNITFIKTIKLLEKLFQRIGHITYPHIKGMTILTQISAIFLSIQELN